MTTGIREFCNARFQHYLPERKALGNTEFRKSVMADVILEFHITLASASTHYNHSLKQQRIVDPTSVADLGRDPSKKGGRKPVHLFTVIKVKTGETVAEGLSKAAAEAMIDLASEKKKAKLAIKEVTDVDSAPTIVSAVDFNDSVLVPKTEATAEEV